MLDKLPEDLREKIIETSFYKEVIFGTSSFTDFITKLHEYIKGVDISLYLYIGTIVFILLFVKNNSNEKVTKKDKNIKVTNLDIDKKLYNPNLIEFLKEKGFIVFIYLKTLIFLIKNIIKEKNYRISFLNSLNNSYLKEKELKFKTNLFTDFLKNNGIDNFQKNFFNFKNKKYISKKIEKGEVIFTELNKIKDIKNINFFQELDIYENEMKKIIKEDFIKSNKNINEILIDVKSDSYRKYLETFLK